MNMTQQQQQQQRRHHQAVVLVVDLSHLPPYFLPFSCGMLKQLTFDPLPRPPTGVT